MYLYFGSSYVSLRLDCFLCFQIWVFNSQRKGTSWYKSIPFYCISQLLKSHFVELVNYMRLFDNNTISFFGLNMLYLNVIFSFNHNIEACHSGIVLMWEVTLSHGTPLAFTCIIDEECVKTSQAPLSLICIWEIPQLSRARRATPRTFASSLTKYQIFMKKPKPQNQKDEKSPLLPGKHRLLWWLMISD